MTIHYAEKDTNGKIPIIITDHYGGRLYLEFRHYYDGGKATSYHTMDKNQVRILRDALTKWLEREEQYERLMRHQQEEYTDWMVAESKKNSERE